MDTKGGRTIASYHKKEKNRFRKRQEGKFKKNNVSSHLSKMHLAERKNEKNGTNEKTNILDCWTRYLKNCSIHWKQHQNHNNKRTMRVIDNKRHNQNQ